MAQVQFSDGVAVEEVVHMFVACDLVSGNFNLTRLCYFRDEDEWGYFDAETIVVSVCAVLKPRRRYFALGRDGVVWSLESGGEPLLEIIADAGTGRNKLGYLTQIREIGDDVYVCGDGGQVYHRGSNGWVHMDDGIREQGKKTKKEPNCHNGIDGTGPDDIYVVGEYGRIFHYNGKTWNDVSFEKKYHLERVRCARKDEVYVCGANGTLLKGNHRGWERIKTGTTDYIWDLEPFENNLYLAVEDRLMVYDGKSVKAIVTGLQPEIDAHRLSSRNGILWSFGENDLACFNGKKWTRVIHPDNA